MKPATHDPYDFSDMHDILGPANGFQNHASFSEILIYPYRESLYLKLLPHFQVIEMKLLFIIIIITIFIIIIIIVIIIIVVNIIFIVITNITTAPR